jgi:hypothetical protein
MPGKKQIQVANDELFTHSAGPGCGAGKRKGPEEIRPFFTGFDF